MRGPLFLFGSMIEYHPCFSTNEAGLHQFGTKVFSLDTRCMREESAKPIFLVTDVRELEILDASVFYVRRLKTKEVLSPKNGEEFMFPFAEETVKLAGRDQVLRTSTLVQVHLARGEEYNDVLQGQPGGSPP